MTKDPVTVDLESTLDSIMHRIGPMSYPEDYDLVKDMSRILLEKGWLPSEIVAVQRCTENVDNTIEEDVALARMASIRADVYKRLASLTKQDLS